MGEKRYQREFVRANPPQYIEMKKGLSAIEWMLGVLEVFKRCRIPDKRLWMKLAVSTFTRVQRFGGKSHKAIIGSTGQHGKTSLDYFISTDCTKRHQVIPRYRNLLRE